VITDGNYIFSTEGEAGVLPDWYEYRHYIQHTDDQQEIPLEDIACLTGECSFDSCMADGWD
jgi:hypothetical protein